jgi:hypothetical protein
VGEVARGWRWRHTWLGLGVGTLSAIQTGILTVPVDHFAAYLRWWLYQVCQFGLPTVFAVRLADLAVENGVARIPAYGGAVSGALIGGAWVGNALIAAFDPAPGFAPGALPTWPIAQVAGWYGLGVAAYVDWRREHQLQERIHARQRQHARQQQALRAEQLLALQARVEPQLLFDAMQRIEARIADLPAEADSQLAELIAMLRAMLPVSGARASTLGREMALVEAFGRVVPVTGLQAPALCWRVAPEAAQAVLAPMVLLPALRGLVAGGATALQVDAWLADGLLRLRLAASAGTGRAVALPMQEATVLRERLLAVHGEAALLEQKQGKEVALDIQLPCQDDQGPHR